MSQTLECKGWVQEAVLRMLRNNLHPDVAEDPDNLIVYGGSGKAARNPAALADIERALKTLEDDETCSFNRARPWEFSELIATRLGCYLPIRFWFRPGPPGSTFGSWRKRVSPCLGK